MAEKTDLEIIEETAGIAKRLERFAKHLSVWIFGMVFLLSTFEIASLLFGDVAYPKYDSAIRSMLLLIWTVGVFYSWLGKEN